MEGVPSGMIPNVFWCRGKYNCLAKAVHKVFMRIQMLAKI
jgi:hypothetical protein